METDQLELHEIKAGVYETWGRINRAFEQIISALRVIGYGFLAIRKYDGSTSTLKSTNQRHALWPFWKPLGSKLDKRLLG